MPHKPPDGFQDLPASVKIPIRLLHQAARVDPAHHGDSRQTGIRIIQLFKTHQLEAVRCTDLTWTSGLYIPVRRFIRKNTSSVNDSGSA